MGSSVDYVIFDEAVSANDTPCSWVYSLYIVQYYQFAFNKPTPPKTTNRNSLISSFFQGLGGCKGYKSIHGGVSSEVCYSLHIIVITLCDVHRSHFVISFCGLFCDYSHVNDIRSRVSPSQLNVGRVNINHM